MTDSNNQIPNKRRDFIVLLSGSMAVVAGCAITWPIIDSMNPSKDVLAMASTEVELSGVEQGGFKKAMWRGKPVFIYRRTKAEIADMEKVAVTELKDPQKDSERVKKGKEEWLVMIGVCTHLGCIPTFGKGDYDAWFCPCHGSHYDKSGRIRKGPAAENMHIPPYEFLNETLIKIG